MNVEEKREGCDFMSTTQLLDTFTHNENCTSDDVCQTCGWVHHTLPFTQQSIYLSQQNLHTRKGWPPRVSRSRNRRSRLVHRAQRSNTQNRADPRSGHCRQDVMDLQTATGDQ
ncbi:hypothetical protein EVAR_72587_1 [Eumeta japonica]|uniref:Uncharacterized protein n=1 Tax=Eumeta variegata TaxID=151549 RepID=A0A4C1SKQ1_EUMVA|nr:hypothetical protein EVAR_72587_1 [Eumeta japonica]